MKKKYIAPAIDHVACATTNMIAASNIKDGRFSDNSMAGGWTPTDVTDASSNSQFSHGQSSDGTGNRAKDYNAWSSWDE